MSVYLIFTRNAKSFNSVRTQRSAWTGLSVSGSSMLCINRVGVRAVAARVKQLSVLFSVNLLYFKAVFKCNTFLKFRFHPIG